MTGTIAMEKIESQREMLNELSYKSWAKPEVGYLEYEACKLSSEALKAAGFEVEVGVFGVPTAIRASFGSGHPVIGLLGEYDALPGIFRFHPEGRRPGYLRRRVPQDRGSGT